MKQNRRKTFALLLALAITMLAAGCAKKTAKVTPPTPPPPASTAPTATLAANPSTVQQGQPSVLTWQTSNASEVSIASLGTLPPSGSRSITPGTSATYTLMAKGSGGTAEASARITVNSTTTTTSSLSDEDLFARNVKDVYFDYDQAAIPSGEAATVQNNQAFLGQHSSIKVLVEGHCDDRGSEEYNLALGTSRAESVRQALIRQGIPADRIRTVSYGKEKPFCTQENEECWKHNRVGHFALDR